MITNCEGIFNKFWVLEVYISIIILTILRKEIMCIFMEQSSSSSLLLFIAMETMFPISHLSVLQFNPIIISLIIRIEMVLEVLVHSPFNHVTQLLA